MSFTSPLEYCLYTSCCFFIQGEIFVSPGAVLDREATPSIDILVTAYDSQLDPSVRRFTEVSVSNSSIDSPVLTSLELMYVWSQDILIFKLQ